MALVHATDTKNAQAVCVHARNLFGELGWTESCLLIDRLFHDIAGAFHGRHPDFQAIDMRYHNFQHTLEATYCLIEILAGRHRAAATPAIDRRDAELALMAVLLHDSGYLKYRGDLEGTGAKYTFVHELRSCDFARRYLPFLGANPEEIEDICTAIKCTGPRNHISTQNFRRPGTRLISAMLVTSDYLAQMGAPDYPDKLVQLYREFEEGYEYEGILPENRPYRSVMQLLGRSHEFWKGFVWPMLDKDCGALHGYLTVKGKPNPYLLAVEENLAEIERRFAGGLVTV